MNDEQIEELEGYLNLRDWETIGSYKFPNFGKVIIEDNVSIGSNCSVMRGTLNNTILFKNVMMSNLINIGHKVIVLDNFVSGKKSNFYKYKCYEIQRIKRSILSRSRQVS